MTAYAKRFVLILLASVAFFLNFAALILLPKYVLHLGYSPTAIGIIMGAYTIAVMIALPLIGIASEQLARKAIFIFGAFVMAVSTPLYSVFTGVFAMTFLRLLQGLGFACAFGMTAAMVFDAVPKEKRRVYLGILVAANMGCTALGPYAGEYIIARMGYPAFFAAASVSGFLAFILGFFLPSTKHKPHRFIMPGNEALGYITATIMLGAVFGTIIFFLPAYLLSIGIPDSGPFFVAFVLGGFAAWWISAKSISGAGKERLFWLAACLMLASLPLLSGHIRGYVMLLFLGIVFGTGYGWLYPTLNVMILEKYPEQRGFANTLSVWSFNLGMSVASFGIGLLVSRYGYVQAIFISGVLALSMSYFHRLYR